MRDTRSIDIAGISAAASAEWQKLALLHVRELLISRGIVALIAAAALIGTVLFDIPLPVPAWLGFIVIGLGFALLATYAVASFRRKAYALTESEVLYRSGVWWRTVTVVPLARIQHVETERGPLERHLGLATLSVFTAGSGDGDLSIPGLELGEAERVRTFLLSKIESAS